METHTGSYGIRECGGQLSREVWGVSHGEGISRAVGEVVENGKNREEWKSIVHLRICKWLGQTRLCVLTGEDWSTGSEWVRPAAREGRVQFWTF